MEGSRCLVLSEVSKTFGCEVNGASNVGGVRDVHIHRSVERLLHVHREEAVGSAGARLLNEELNIYIIGHTACVIGRS